MVRSLAETRTTVCAAQFHPVSARWCLVQAVRLLVWLVKQHEGGVMQECASSMRRSPQESEVALDSAAWLVSEGSWRAFLRLSNLFIRCIKFCSA